MNAGSKRAEIGKPKDVLPSQSLAQPSGRPLTVARLKAIAWALVQINQLKGLELSLEDAERFACRILLDERES